MLELENSSPNLYASSIIECLYQYYYKLKTIPLWLLAFHNHDIGL